MKASGGEMGRIGSTIAYPYPLAASILFIAWVLLGPLF
jgi:hypothetical protein